MRVLSEHFMDDLVKPDGLLYPILTQVKKDHTLMLAIRKDNINIYYRGGNILKLMEDKKGYYKTFFEPEYNKFGKVIPLLPGTIEDQDDAKKWVASLPEVKNIMDEFFSVNGRAEREFQQLVARENNDSTISNESEYFISDIEFADSELHARIDLLAIRWLATQRKNGSNCRAALIEMKYGDGSLSGSAGLLKHLKDFDVLISDKKRYQLLVETMESQFNQLDILGLLSFKRCSNGTKVKLSAIDKPEVIFILADHNPRSTKLWSLINSPEIIAYEQSQLFNLRFFVSSFAGYGLHADCMVDLTQFRGLLKKSNTNNTLNRT